MRAREDALEMRSTSLPLNLVAAARVVHVDDTTSVRDRDRAAARGGRARHERHRSITASPRSDAAVACDVREHVPAALTGKRIPSAHWQDARRHTGSCASLGLAGPCCLGDPLHAASRRSRASTPLCGDVFPVPSSTLSARRLAGRDPPLRQRAAPQPARARGISGVPTMKSARADDAARH